MSKKHHHHNGDRGEDQTAPAGEAESPELDKMQGDQSQEDEQQNEEDQESTVEAAAPVNEQEPKQDAPVPAQSAHPTITINPTVVKQPEVKKMEVPNHPIAGTFAAARKAAETGSMGRTVLGQKVKTMLGEYAKRMSVPSNDIGENRARIKMLQDILGVACPSNALDMETATDVVRIVFDHFRVNWGRIYDDTTIFRAGRSLKGTAYDMDKLVMFFTAFTELAEAAKEKDKKVTFDDVRVSKVLRNPNIAIALCRIRDNINARNGYKAQ